MLKGPLVESETLTAECGMPSNTIVHQVDNSLHHRPSFFRPLNSVCAAVAAAAASPAQVRSGKQAGRRGGMGAVRIRETYLRRDGLLVNMRDTLLGEGGGGEGEREAETAGGESAPTGARGCGWAGRNGGGGRRRYVCPTADFLHCYLELFGRPSFAACFRRGTGGGSQVDAAGTSAPQAEPAAAAGDGGGEEGGGGCSLLLLHSELSKLTGAAGALSMRQERNLAQVMAAAADGGLFPGDSGVCPNQPLCQLFAAVWEIAFRTT